MTSPSIALALLAALACAHGAAVNSSGRSLNPMVWPMPSIGSQLLAPEIIGGQDAADAEFPHQVSMQVSMLWLMEQHICGGTVLNEEWVLTAAHCVKGVPWYTTAFVLAGKTNLRNKEEGQQRAAIKKMYVHEKYQSHKNNGVGPYDIGLLHLKDKLVLTSTVKPARLPVQGALPTGQTTLTGWGSISTSNEVVLPSQLQKLDLPVIAFEQCNAWMLKQAGDNPSDNPLSELSNVCVGYLDKVGQGACSGDSGGPLIQRDSNGDVVVIGATSWGFFPCQESAAPSVYTKVSAFVDWINEKIAKNK